MGRPKKTERSPGETREQLYQRALELFAQRGYGAVSVRDITGSLGLKAALLETIFTRLEERLIDPGFQIPPPEAFFDGGSLAPGAGPFEPAEFLIEGARRFYRQAGREVLLTWRLLMISQFQYPAARRSLEAHLLDAPVRFFTGTLESMRAAGRLPEGLECRRAGRIAADIFFQYSFRANLKAAWQEHTEEGGDEDFEQLAGDIRFLLGSPSSFR